MLAQRFKLDIAFGHRDAVSYVETTVASHLRICINTTEDRTWSYTTYPSEPFLSYAAASLLHAPEDNLGLTLATLETMVNEGVIDIGQIGELCSRFLWLLAKDFFVRSKLEDKDNVKGKGRDKDKAVSELDQELPGCRLVSVVEFLEFVFGSTFWKDVAKAKKQFDGAYINFSHWVSMEYNIRRSKKDLEQLPYVTCSIYFQS